MLNYSVAELRFFTFSMQKYNKNLKNGPFSLKKMIKKQKNGQNHEFCPFMMKSFLLLSL